jgi:uncharacterized protein YbaR (Trm112 family)
MPEMNFCPFCDAPQHKLMLCKDNIFYCKQCNRFFKFEDLDIHCPRCKGSIQKSDFSSPSGAAVFLCMKCKRTYPVSEILEGIK